MNAYIDEIESPGRPARVRGKRRWSPPLRLHFIESDYGPVMEEDLEDEGYAVDVTRPEPLACEESWLSM